MQTNHANTTTPETTNIVANPPKKRAGRIRSAKSHFDHGEKQALYIDDSDNELVPSMPSNNPEGSHSRSRSITPPPELAPEQRMKARDLVRRALGLSNRRSDSPQPTHFDHHEADDMETFDPELASIVLRSTQGGSSLPSRTGEGDHPHEVIINVYWRCNPSEVGGKPHKWTFRANRSGNLRPVFKAVAEAIMVTPDDIVLTLGGHRVYSSVSPAALGIWSDGEFDACLRETYELLKDSRLRPTFASRTTVDEDEGGEEGSSDTGSTGDVAADTFKLTIRSIKTPKGIILTVRPQTKCGAIVRAYLRKAGLADEYLGYDAGTTDRNRGRRSIIISSGPRLVVDGDKLDNEVEIKETDLEDGDIVEITGL